MTGTIKTKTARGFGFITVDGESNGKDLFFHSSELVDVTFDSLEEGVRVEFEVVQGPKGPNAKGVRVIQEAVA